VKKPYLQTVEIGNKACELIKRYVCLETCLLSTILSPI